MPPPPPSRPSGNLVVCNTLIYADAPIVNFMDNPNFSAYRQGCYRGKDGSGPPPIHPFAPAKGLENAVSRFRERRLMGGKRDLRRLQEIIRQFVLHHDGCADSAMCFHVLHDERGLSVHFLIDNDGVIYQTLDICDGAFHATGVNEISLGVELCSRGKVDLDGPEYYRRRYPNNPVVRDRNVTRVRIHNSNYEMWEYTSAQYDSMIRLGKALARLLPNLPQAYPQYNGQIVNTWLADPRVFAGYVGHYHVTNQKWDPGCFNFAYFCDKIRSHASWFVALDRGEARRAPEIADDPERAEQQGQELVRNNEEDAMGGYFPVGPFGKSRLWHGGIHINLNEGTPLFCPFPGRVVACRFGDDVAIGSRNFVLLRHTFHLGGQPVVFFLLFFHLERADPTSGRVPWLRDAEKRPFWAQIQSDEVAYPDIDLAGGDVIGHPGLAGPPGSFEPQVHVQIMSAEDLGARLQPGFFTPIDASKGGHFCDVPEILSLIDRPRGKGDGVLTEGELRQFFQRDEARVELRKMAVRFPSEWGAASDYEAQLLRSKDFARLPRAARARLYRDQIEPTLWWTEELAEKVGLPTDYVVWHYHPVRFVAWMNAMLLRRATQAAAVQLGKDEPQVQADDGIRTGMTAFTDEEDEYSIEAGRKLGLEDLARGYPEETKK